jgi:hypothetical protein
VKIYTAWIEDNDGYHMVSAYDGATYESWGRVPDWYLKEVEQHRDIRELVVTIPSAAVHELFRVVEVDGTAEPAEGGGS